MSGYTAGEIAKLCGVSVRMVQYYDTRGILAPSGFTEGGRRLYSDEDLKRMKIICFLRDAGITINSIGELLSEEDPGSVISAVIEQQEGLLRKEISEGQAKLAVLEGMKRELKGVEKFSVESLGDIAAVLENKKKMKRLHMILVMIGIPVGMIQWTALILMIAVGIWQPFALFVLMITPCVLWLSGYYFKRTAYICPRCHGGFRPGFREFFSRSTARL